MAGIVALEQAIKYSDIAREKISSFLPHLARRPEFEIRSVFLYYGLRNQFAGWIAIATYQHKIVGTVHGLSNDKVEIALHPLLRKMAVEDMEKLRRPITLVTYVRRGESYEVNRTVNY